MIALLLLACVHRPPAPLLPPPPEVEIPPERLAAWEPGLCRGEDVDPGVPLDCTGIAISVPQADRVELQVADLALVSRWLLEERGARLTDRGLYEDERLRTHAALRDAERSAMVGRWAFVVGVVVGGATAIGVLAAAEGVSR